MYIELSVYFNVRRIASRQAVVSCEAKKKQHAYTSSGLHNHYSELSTQMAGLDF